MLETSEQESIWGPCLGRQVSQELGEREGTEEDFPEEMKNIAILTFF